jgi:hypothetical protein
MKKFSIYLVCIAMVILTGCLSKVQDRSSQPVLQTSRSFNRNFDAIWKATVKACADLQLPITVIEKDSGFIGINSFSFSNPSIAYRDYTKGKIVTGFANTLAPMVAFTVTMNIYVSDSTVKINATFKSTRHDAEYGDTTQPAPTNGVLESKLLDRIQANLE